MEQVVVKIDNLVKRYKELIALDHFSLCPMFTSAVNSISTA